MVEAYISCRYLDNPSRSSNVHVALPSSCNGGSAKYEHTFPPCIHGDASASMHLMDSISGSGWSLQYQHHQPHGRIAVLVVMPIPQECALGGYVPHGMIPPILLPATLATVLVAVFRSSLFDRTNAAGQVLHAVRSLLASARSTYCAGTCTINGGDHYCHFAVTTWLAMNRNQHYPRSSW